MTISTIQRMVADTISARILFSMLGKSRATPTAQRRDLYEVYEPPRVRKTVLLLYGLALAGENDPRLVRFARALAAGGLKVVVPILDGLKQYRFDPADQAALLEVASRFRAENNAPLAVVAFSAGASLALTTAATSAGRDLFDPLVLFSPLYDLETVWKVFHSQPEMEFQNTQAWDDYVWVQCVIAYRNQELLGLSPATRQQLADVLLRYSVGMPTPEKVEFYENHIKPLKIAKRTDFIHEGETLARLSPRGKLAELDQRVILLQSPSDTLLPADEIQSLFAELKQRKSGQTWLLNTPLLAHANLGSIRHISDAWQLIHLLGELFV